MSIASAPGSPPAKIEPSDSTILHPLSKPAEEPLQTVSVVFPQQQKTVAKPPASTYELPEDVVEVHQDSASKDQVVQYLDKARNVVLQMPSNQELDVERGIVQEFQQAAKARAAESRAVTENEGAKSHGH